MKAWGVGRLDFTAKIRLFALLSFLFLLVILLSATVLFGEANRQLERELEVRLTLVARVGGQQLQDALPRPEEGALADLRARAQGQIEMLHREAGVARVALLLRDGSLLEAPAPADSRPFSPPSQAWQPRLEAEGRAPRLLFTDYYWAGGSYFRTLFWPLREPGQAPWALLAVEERANFLGF
ncbi:MAG: hypothetical protein ACREJI_03710, partial [Candidatus Methylomirabilales bacterium]